MKQSVLKRRILKRGNNRLKNIPEIRGIITRKLQRGRSSLVSQISLMLWWHNPRSWWGLFSTESNIYLVFLRKVSFIKEIFTSLCQCNSCRTEASFYFPLYKVSLSMSGWNMFSSLIKDLLQCVCPQGVWWMCAILCGDLSLWPYLPSIRGRVLTCIL